MDSIPAGQLRHKLTLQSFTVTSTDSRGQPVGSWEDQEWLRGSIEPVGPREADLVNQLVHDATHIVHVRYCANVTRAKRFTHDGRAFAIGHVADLGGRHRVMRVLCSEEL